MGWNEVATKVPSLIHNLSSTTEVNSGILILEKIQEYNREGHDLIDKGGASIEVYIR